MEYKSLLADMGKKSLALAGALGLLTLTEAQEPQETGRSSITFRGYDTTDNYSREIGATGLKAVAVLSRTNTAASLFGISWKPIASEGISYTGINPSPHYTPLGGLTDIFCAEISDGTNVCYTMDVIFNRVGPKLHDRVVADAVERVGPKGNLTGILAEYSINRTDATVTNVAPYTFHHLQLKDSEVRSLPPTIQDIKGDNDFVSSEKFTFIVYGGDNKPNPLVPHLVADPVQDGTRVYSTGGKSAGKNYAIECSSNLQDWKRLTPGVEGVSLVGTNHITGAFEVFAPKGISGSQTSEFFRSVSR